jgi:hypothetical protein
VYWTTLTAVVKMPLESGSPQTLVDGLADAQPWWIAVDANFVYWTNSGDPYANTGSVAKVPILGGTPTTLASGLATPTGLAIDDARVYWTNDGSVLAVPISGGQVESIALSEPGALGVAVDATHVYWANSDARVVRRISKTNGARPETIANARWPYGVTADATSVYWTNYNDSSDGGSVMKVALDGGIPITIATGTENAWSIRVDPDAVYWATRREIMKADLDGGHVETLASFADPLWIALTDNDVYWASLQLGTSAPAIRKIAK